MPSGVFDWFIKAITRLSLNVNRWTVGRSGDAV